MKNVLHQKLSTEPMFLMMKTIIQKFTLVYQTHPLKKGMETIKEPLNIKNMRIVPNF